MMKDIFNVAEQGGLFFVAPISAQNNGRYVIQCRSKSEAQQTIRRINSNQQPTPLEDGTQYVKIEEVAGTPIYQNKG
jgi:hypothetical protein